MFEKINHEDLVRDKIISHYRESNVVDWIIALLSEANNLEDVFSNIIKSRMLDHARDAELDVIGYIVGQSRILVDANVFNYFGFSPNSQANSFGTTIDPSVGGRFRSVREPSIGFRTLNDDEYKLLIRSRIIKNNTGVTREDIISQLKFLFNAPSVIVTEETMKICFLIGRILTSNEVAIIENTDILPKPTGVTMCFLGSYDGTGVTGSTFFGFAGIPNSSGFDDVNNPGSGGTLGSIQGNQNPNPTGIPPEAINLLKPNKFGFTMEYAGGGDNANTTFVAGGESGYFSSVTASGINNTRFQIRGASGNAALPALDSIWIVVEATKPIDGNIDVIIANNGTQSPTGTKNVEFQSPTNYQDMIITISRDPPASNTAGDILAITFIGVIES